MKQTTNLPSEKILGGLWGSLVGDALGVPVEFKDRQTVQQSPVKDMFGYGIHRQPPGTWSDDSSLLLCSADSLIAHPHLDPQDMGNRFVRWRRKEIWSPHGEVFDIGTTTIQALNRIAEGVPAEMAGLDSANSNGNGSLMRIIPVSLRFAGRPTKKLLDYAQRASAITHRHARSQMACGFFSLFVRELLLGSAASVGFNRSIEIFREHYERSVYWSVELDHFETILDPQLALRPVSQISSSGYVLHTLEASIWCLLTTNSYHDCVLKAVNLGGDTDTTGCVAGGLAGVLYGLTAVPKNWLNILARKNDVKLLFEKFVQICESL
jgi:ADP-ribosyl-[dinitrogen reductase] hydrolase